MKYFKHVIVFCISVLCLVSCKGTVPNADTIIPRPMSLTIDKGSFIITSATKVFFENIDQKEKELFLGLLKQSKQDLGEASDPYSTNMVKLSLIDNGETNEAYRLTITQNNIEIEASTGAGVFYGLQSLLQLLDANGSTLPAVTINDSPRFPYRGFMLDVSRHFRSKEFVKKQLDVMAYYKLNHFHFHLTDGAGWRIEIKKYPKLTETAAFRPIEDYKTWIEEGKPFCQKNHPTAYGGYYTQEEIKEIVAYATERHITIIPEIEMPGHSEEVLTVYPHLSCSGKPGVNSEFCVGNEDTFTFIEDVLTEVMELFPSKLIHIGGDEADKTPWKTCPKCRHRMNQEGIKDVDGLQSYMIHRVEEFLNKNDKDLLGWDEILEGGLTPNATVMSWRGEQGGVAAAQAGNRVIMTPNSHCYLDGYQDAPIYQRDAMSGFLPLNKVYSYDPLPKELGDSPELILGVQANLWEEWIVEDDHAEMMIYPRLLAIAEVGWTPLARKDLSSFRERVVLSSKQLKDRGVNFFDINKEVGAREESKIDIKHLALNQPVSYKYPYHPKYIATAEAAMTDGRRGNWSYSDGVWQGFLESDIDITIDLEQITTIKEITATFLQEYHAWIWMPKEVNIYISADNKDFTLITNIKNDFPAGKTGYHLKDFGWTGNTQTRYIRYVAIASGRDGGWLFTDEIIVN